VNLVIAGCSRRKVATAEPVPALELYQGGCIPWLRARVGASRQLRARVRILSALHGLVPADRPLLPYDRRMDLARASALSPAVADAVHADFPDEVLAVVEPLYMVCLADLLGMPGRPFIRWVPDPLGGWSEAAAVLDEWGW
jgi:hypothetical protein